MKKRIFAMLLVCALAAGLVPTVALGATSNFEIDANGTLIKYNGPGGDVVIPDGVTGIGFSAFHSCEALASITIPSSVTFIGCHAFSYCSNLTSVTILKGLTRIEDNAFLNCHSLTSITIPNGVTSIGKSAFGGCYSLTSVTIPDSVTSIGYAAFSACFDLTRVTIPASVTSIGRLAFFQCTSLTSAGPIGGDYSIEFGWTSMIPPLAFGQCEGLTSVSIPTGVISIGHEAFYCCNNLTKIYYEGTEAQWEAIDISAQNCDAFNSAFIHYTSGITQTTLTEKHYPGTPQTVPSTWAEAEVNNARDNGLIPAELDGNYTGNITRAEFCNLGVKLVKSLGKENLVFNKATVVLDGKRFSDTDDENVIAMCNAGVVNGYTDGRFGPNDPITREQAAVMLARLARKLGGDLRNGLEPQYRDGLSISAWAREDVAYISRCETAGHKAVMGGSNGYFSPKNYYTREQAFLTFQRLYECATNTASGAGTSSGRIEPENNMEKGEQALAQRAVELVQTLSDQAKAKEANPFLGQEDQLEALKKTIHVTPTAGLNSDKDIPDAVYYAFAGAIYEAMEDSSIEKLEYDGNKLVNQIYDAVKNGLLNGTKTVAVTTGKGKNRTTTSYTVTYRITALAGAQTSEATVSWNNGSKRVLLTSADVTGTQKALANFCAALAQLNKEAWNEFLSCYFGNAFGLMGFDIKKDDVKKALSVSEKVIKAIDDPREADKFLAEAGDELSQSVKDQLKSGWFDSEIGKLVKECVPNGDKIVEAAKVYLKAREKYDAWTSAVEARKNMDEVQKLYADFSGVLSELDSILNEIAP